MAGTPISLLQVNEAHKWLWNYHFKERKLHSVALTKKKIVEDGGWRLPVGINCFYFCRRSEARLHKCTRMRLSCMGARTRLHWGESLSDDGWARAKAQSCAEPLHFWKQRRHCTWRVHVCMQKAVSPCLRVCGHSTANDVKNAVIYFWTGRISEQKHLILLSDLN